jgi:AcrR family transcriptional regulator
LLLDSTERLMLDEGYASVTYRHVAAKSGVTAGLVQYYFPTLDDLFIALLERRSTRNLERFSELLEAHEEGPLRAIWEQSRDETTAALMIEIMALGNHRKAIRAEIAAVGERARKSQLEALSKVSSKYRFEGTFVPPAALLFLLAGIPKVMLMEGELGQFTGHAETLALVEHCLNLVEPLQTTSSSNRKATGTTKAKPRRTATS